MKQTTTTAWAALVLLNTVAVFPTACSKRSAPAGLSFERSLMAGVEDVNGRKIVGTEVLRLVPHKGSLFATTSAWMESDSTVPATCQVVVLDSPDNRWHVDYQCPRGIVRISSIRSVTFSSDAEGRPIAPVSMLIAAPDAATGDFLVMSRDDSSNAWVPMALAPIPANITRFDGYHHTTARAMGFHRDRLTHVDRVFVGTDAMGTFSGAYDPSVPGRIRWNKKPELPTPHESRVTGFAECNGDLFVSTSRQIYRRKDGPKGEWQAIYSRPDETMRAGIRALTAVPNPDGKGEALLFVARDMVRRLDPLSASSEVVELNLPLALTEWLGAHVESAFVPADEFKRVDGLVSGTAAWVFGVEPHFQPAVAAQHPTWGLLPFLRDNDAWYQSRQAIYMVRQVEHRKANYFLAEIDDAIDPLVSVRTVEVSPFQADGGRALYFGGFDCNGRSFHNSAWIYRARF